MTRVIAFYGEAFLSERSVEIALSLTFFFLAVPSVNLFC